MTIQKVTDTATASLNTAVKAAVSNNGSRVGGVGDAGDSGIVDGIETLRDTVSNVVHAYPSFIRAMPFCCWKQGKVPYTPVNGKKARVDDVRTFGTLDEAYNAYMSVNTSYKGIGLKVSESLGAIDLDKCVNDDVAKDFRPLTLASLSENAQRVLSLFPHAVVELSPSRAGLHIFFKVPKGFTFDRDEYYINNRKLGIEVYFADTTNRFLTVTGNLINTGKLFAASLATAQTADKSVLVDGTESGDGADDAESADKAIKTVIDTGHEPGHVSSEALMQFLNSFMKRPEAKLAQVTLPEGGSILTDEEVLSKAKSGKNGDRFTSLYEGDWLRVGESDINWSHSEADIALCGFLAFYCRGDLSQMDRLFRASGLMRDKWDRPQSNSSYGVITMTNAIAHCQNFYDPKSEWEKQVNTFKGIIDSLVKEASETKGGVNVERLLAEDALIAAAWAMRFDTAYYVKLRSIVPQTLGLRLYEKNVKAHLSSLPLREPRGISSSGGSCDDSGLEPLVLTGAETAGFYVPVNWRVDDNGIFFIKIDGGEEYVANEPMFVSKRLVDFDTRDRRLEITFRDEDSTDFHYSTLTAPRADMRNKHKITNYANEGLDVISDTASLLTRYLAAMENSNKKALAFTICVTRAGWVKDDMVPLYMPSNRIIYQDDEDQSLDNMADIGDKGFWKAAGREVRKYPLARAILAASFASPLLAKLQQRNIYYHSWGNSKSGKTAALKFAISVWGNPAKLLYTYSSTHVGLERKAALMQNLPLAIDELQNIDKKISLNNLVYTLANGVGKIRGKASGGTRTTLRWNNIILSTGEQPITNDSSMDGVYTRVLEVYGKPLPDEELGHVIHQIAEENYGGVGIEYIKFIIEKVLSAPASTATKTLPTPQTATLSSAMSANAANPVPDSDDAGKDADKDAAAVADNSSDNNINTLGGSADKHPGAGDKAADALDEAAIDEAEITAILGKTAKEASIDKSKAEEDANKDAKALAKEYAEQDKKWRENLDKAKKKAGAKGGRLFDDLETIISTLGSLYGRTDPKIRDISIIALGDYYSSISVFGLTEEQAMQEAIALGGVLMKNQIMLERKDTIDHAWDFTCGWVIRNKNKFLTPEMTDSNTEVFGKIVRAKKKGNTASNNGAKGNNGSGSAGSNSAGNTGDSGSGSSVKYYYVIASILSEALKTAGFTSEDKCFKGFAERGYIVTTQEKGKLCYQPSRRIRGDKSRVYILNMDAVETSVAEAAAVLAEYEEAEEAEGDVEAFLN